MPQLPEIFLLGAIPPDRQFNGRDCITVFDHMCVACHGFSVLIAGRRGATTQSALFDVGPYGDVWVENASRLAIDLATIDTLFLSHWHWDHSGGIPTVVAAIAEAKHSAGMVQPLVVDLHPDRPDQRGIQLPSGPMVMLSEEPTIEAIEEAGGQIVTEADAHLFGNGFFASSGSIPRRTEFETGFAWPPHLLWQPRRRRSIDPRRTTGGHQSPRTRHHSAVSVFACRDCKCLSRGADPGPGRTHRSRAGRISPCRRIHRGSYCIDGPGPCQPDPPSDRGSGTLHRLEGKCRSRGGIRPVWIGSQCRRCSIPVDGYNGLTGQKSNRSSLELVTPRHGAYRELRRAWRAP